MKIILAKLDIPYIIYLKIQAVFISYFAHIGTFKPRSVQLYKNQLTNLGMF